VAPPHVVHHSGLRCHRRPRGIFLRFLFGFFGQSSASRSGKGDLVTANGTNKGILIIMYKRKKYNFSLVKSTY